MFSKYRLLVLIVLCFPFLSAARPYQQDLTLIELIRQSDAIVVAQKARDFKAGGDCELGWNFVVKEIIFNKPGIKVEKNQQIMVMAYDYEMKEENCMARKNGKTEYVSGGGIRYFGADWEGFRSPSTKTLILFINKNKMMDGLAGAFEFPADGAYENMEKKQTILNLIK
jgi:hypothetical protein